jgi:ureidoglycolate lyase
VGAQILTSVAYAPYGAVVAAGRPDDGRDGNVGRARIYKRLAPLEDRRPGVAKPTVSVFRCAPWIGPVRVALLEKHPASTQMFIPMNARRYLVIVALGGDRPDLDTVAAFLATGVQGVTYGPGVWHHPMFALDTETDFACVVWEDGGPDDCRVVQLAAEDVVDVVF